MILHPFRALRCTPTAAEHVPSVPYDVVSTPEAAKLAEGNADSFLRVVRSEIDLDPQSDPYAPAVYARAAANLEALVERGLLTEEDQPSLYVYRMSLGDHHQTGLFACCSVDEYERGIIKKHELTRKQKEDDRTNHIISLKAQCGPVILTYKDDDKIQTMLDQCSEGSPLLTNVSEDGVVHEIWRISSPQPFVDAFAKVPFAYIADGHHRSASAARACERLSSENSDHTGQEEYNFLLAAIFPASQMRILAYNRAVNDLGGQSPEEVLTKAEEFFEVFEASSPVPDAPNLFCIYISGQWYALKIKPEYAHTGDPVRSLDCSLIQEYFIEPILGIKELRTDPRIQFVGGSRGIIALEKLVDSGDAAIAFSMFPTTVDQLMAIADANEIMPPKSTWFEPKLRSGLVVHRI